MGCVTFERFCAKNFPGNKKLTVVLYLFLEPSAFLTSTNSRCTVSFSSGFDMYIIPDQYFMYEAMSESALSLTNKFAHARI